MSKRCNRVTLSDTHLNSVLQKKDYRWRRHCRGEVGECVVWGGFAFSKYQTQWGNVCVHPFSAWDPLEVYTLWVYCHFCFVFFYEGTCLRLTNHRSGLRLTYLFNQYSIRARRVQQLVGDVLRWDECSINWDSCKTLPESAVLSQWSAQPVLFWSVYCKLEHASKHSLAWAPLTGT